ncbi:Aspartyl-tRNA(Asn) amidotransferase subunit A [Acidisarcina polymorpha]|uniref:Aspartyl-tRNA(Asn) amidotransferase subunit A n=1 Tax=Acidisarcina polymorpha TaxID=2211140 RepID=A0A2Z5G357_9BACT|nr:amidase [Acidisarcina polymorpha]AXC13552.1 Aspartyl-tRNA(Asn) amidotransferase subunit A [Acidisarcina polymorpha]
MCSELIYCDATKLAEIIRTKEVSPVEVVQAHLDRMQALNPKLNAIVTLADNSLEMAKAAEAVVLSGEELGPLHGVPFTVKDSIDTAGVLTQRGSPIFKGRIPETDALSVARLKSAGAILLAKTNLPEFSYATETDNLLTGRTNNPWNLNHTPGGSSGGESASIAAGLSPLGLGSDVAISLRGPAAHTGIVALKATHGRIPMTGLWPRVPRRFWHVGPMARSVRDLALAYSLLAGPDGADGFSTAPLGLDSGLDAWSNQPLRVGWLVELGFGTIDHEVAATVKAAAAALSSAGCIVDPVQLPALELISSIDVFFKLQKMEAKPAFREATKNQEGKVFKYVQGVLANPDTSMKDYVQAEQQAERLRDQFVKYFQRYDALLCPVTPIPAPVHGLSEFVINGETVPATNMLGATVPFNITGLPALSIRFGTSGEGLPLGVQLVSGWFAESVVLHLASLLEMASPVRNLHPPVGTDVSSRLHLDGHSSQ